jgi:hypothetical protein
MGLVEGCGWYTAVLVHQDPFWLGVWKGWFEKTQCWGNTEQQLASLIHCQSGRLCWDPSN